MSSEVKVLDSMIVEAKKVPKPKTPPPEPKEEKAPPKGKKGKVSVPRHLIIESPLKYEALCNQDTFLLFIVM